MKRALWWCVSAWSLAACTGPTGVTPGDSAGADASVDVEPAADVVASDVTVMDAGARDASSAPDASVDAGPPVLVQMVSTEQTTLVLRSNGQILFWGRDPRAMTMATTATSLGVVSDAVEVAMFLANEAPHPIFVRRRDGTLARWNYTTNTAEPFGALTGVTRLAAGAQFACAVHGGGRVSCWGDNGFGQLGDGTRVARSAPVEVLGLTDAVEVDGGLGTTCARRRDGRVSCWGRNFEGSLGDGVAAHESCGMEDCSSRPVTVADVADAAEVSVGLNNACVRRASGQVACWGWNAFGMVGDGTMVGRNRPAAVTGLADARSVHTMFTHNCAVRTSGEALCWGEVAMIGAMPLRPIAELRGAVEMSGNSSFACARLGANEVRCVGGNSFGQLGDGTTQTRMTAVRVTGL